MVPQDEDLAELRTLIFLLGDYHERIRSHDGIDVSANIDRGCVAAIFYPAGGRRVSRAAGRVTLSAVRTARAKRSPDSPRDPGQLIHVRIRLIERSRVAHPPKRRSPLRRGRVGISADVLYLRASRVGVAHAAALAVVDGERMRSNIITDKNHTKRNSSRVERLNCVVFELDDGL